MLLPFADVPVDPSRRQALARCSVAAATAWAGLSGCDRQPAADAPAQPLRLAMDLWPGYYPALLADEHGWLAQAKVQLSVSFPGNTDRMVADFAAGRHDMVAVSLGDLINTTRGHSSVQVVLVADESAGGDVVLARRGLASASDALRVATNLGGFGELFLRDFAARQQLDTTRWVWVNADAAEVPSLLAHGLADLGHTWEPYVSQAVAEGARPLFSSAQTPGLITDVLAVTHATLERRAPLLRAFVAAWLRAVDWWMANPTEAARMIARRIQVPEASVTLKGVRLMSLQDNRRLLGAPGQVAALTPVVGRYSDFFLSRGALARPVNAPSFLRPDLLP